MKANMDFLVVDGVLIGVLIGILETEKLNAHIVLIDQYFGFIIEKKPVHVGLEPVGSVGKK